MRFSQVFQRSAKIYCAPSYSVDDEIMEAAGILMNAQAEFVHDLHHHHFGDHIMMIEGKLRRVCIRQTPDLFIFLDQFYEKGSYWVTCNGVPVRPQVDWYLYDNGKQPNIKVHPRMKGGARRCDYIVVPERQPKWSMLPEYGHTQRYFKQYRKQQKFEFWSAYKLSNVEETFELQSRNGTEPVDFQETLSKFLDANIVSLLEDLGLLLVQFCRAKTNTDKLLSLIVFCKLRSGQSLVFSASQLISDVFNDLIGAELQADDGTQELLDKITDFRSLLANWDSLKECSLVQKMMKVYKFAIAVGVASAMGLNIDKTTIAICKKEMGVDLLGMSFPIAVLDAVALILQRLLMFKQTGEWSTFFHGPKSYGQWYDECAEIKRQSMFLGDLESVGSSYHDFVRNVRVAIENGEAILKYGQQTTGFEIKSIKGLLNDIKLIQANLLTYSEAQKSRRPPFALLVHSGSSLAKSTFVDMLFKYTAQILNLPNGEEFKYPRNSVDPYWSGWNSSKWFILLDDIAYVNPNSPVQDNSLMELIQLVNDVPLVPNQAALEDKGKNPVRAKVLIATTNIKHLNAHAHFACPLAVQRRLPFVVNVFPKPQYARDDSPGMLDPAKLPEITDDWPDFWLIEVEKVVAAGENMAKHEPVMKFSNIHFFLDWLRETMELFNEIQTRATLGSRAMSTFVVCKECNRVRCECARLQSGRIMQVPDHVTIGEDFDITFEDGGLTFHEQYVCVGNDELNYVCTSTTYRGNEKLYDITRPIRCVKSCQVATQLQAQEQIEYADIVSQIVRLQAERAQTFTSRIISLGICGAIDLYSRYRVVRTISHWIMDWQIPRKIVLKVAMWYMNTDSSLTRRTAERLGRIARKAYLMPRWEKVLCGITAASAALALYTCTSAWSKPTTKLHDYGDHIVVNDKCYCKSSEIKTCVKETWGVDLSNVKSVFDAQVQGARQSVSDDSFEKTEKENVWKRDDYEVSTFDMTPLNVQYNSLSFDQLSDIVRRNVARFKCSNGSMVREGNAFCVGGHLWVTNSHTVFDEGDLVFTLMTKPNDKGLNPNVSFKIRQHELFWDKAHDQVWFQVLCWEVKRDLRPLIAKSTLNLKTKAALIGYAKDLSKFSKRLDTVTKGHCVPPKLDVIMPAWCGWSREPTLVGDCGAPWVTFGEPCTAIVGLHMMARPDGQVWCTALTTTMVETAAKHFDRPILQCQVPSLSSPSAEKSLGPLRQWSPLRWVEEGSIKAFGSFTGYQPTPRSKVRKTLLGDKILEERGWNVDGCAPIMNDWRPWNYALNDVTKQSYGAVDTVILRSCAQAYVDDVLSLLPKGALKNLQVLSDKAVINGITGVKFIDKMNFKSSMGEPFRKQKKYFLSGTEGNMEFNDEVMERIRYMEENYNQGICCGAIFCGQLKDEVRARKKVIDGKLRVFLSAPVDYCFMSRKYLLTSVKLMQENPFIFEASPGCAAQTLEWEQYFDFLTQFGADRMVAGDYGKFDKKMEASMVMEAFWILIQLLKAAEWTDEEVLPVWCIAEDTAYAYCNFNGDLVQFFGSNPSGHPLTVIINCLVNALYMRYCYVHLDPSCDSVYTKARRFKKHVALLTYGDDNTMGVSPRVEWFNHTAIQRVLASIGVEYTMADKESESVPYIHINQVSYLKRKWRWDEDIGAIVCPLEISSIHKMLTMCVPSGEESPEFHMASVMVSAANEWFWYGKETFTKEREWLVKIATENGILRELDEKKLPTWEDLVIRFWKSSEGVETNRLKGCFDEHPRDILA